jgi:hypothetical protein
VEIVGSEAARYAALAAAVGFLVVAGFQAALALGAPWGRAAWGGTHEGRLPQRLRIASGFAALFWIAAAFVVLVRAGYEISLVPFAVARWGTWALFGLSALGAVMNLASRSKLERVIWSPISAVLALLCLVVALGSASNG